MYCLAFLKVKPCNLLHEAVLCDSFSSDEFVQIVKGLGKHWLVYIDLK